jgi:hypothetical protein
MGIVSGRKLNDFFQKWMVQLLLCNHYPLINGIVVAYLSHLITETLVTALFLQSSLRGASYIAVPAAMKIAVQKQILNFPAYGTSYYLSFYYI